MKMGVLQDSVSFDVMVTSVDEHEDENSDDHPHVNKNLELLIIVEITKIKS